MQYYNTYAQQPAQTMGYGMDAGRQPYYPPGAASTTPSYGATQHQAQPTYNHTYNNSASFLQRNSHLGATQKAGVYNQPPAYGAQAYHAHLGQRQQQQQQHTQQPQRVSYQSPAGVPGYSNAQLGLGLSGPNAATTPGPDLNAVKQLMAKNERLIIKIMQHQQALDSTGPIPHTGLINRIDKLKAKLQSRCAKLAHWLDMSALDKVQKFQAQPQITRAIVLENKVVLEPKKQTSGGYGAIQTQAQLQQQQHIQQLAGPNAVRSTKYQEVFKCTEARYSDQWYTVLQLPNGPLQYLGRFYEEEDAANAYIKAVQALRQGVLPRVLGRFEGQVDGVQKPAAATAPKKIVRKRKKRGEDDDSDYTGSSSSSDGSDSSDSDDSDRPARRKPKRPPPRAYAQQQQQQQPQQQGVQQQRYTQQQQQQYYQQQQQQQQQQQYYTPQQRQQAVTQAAARAQPGVAQAGGVAGGRQYSDYYNTQAMYNAAYAQQGYAGAAAAAAATRQRQPQQQIAYATTPQQQFITPQQAQAYNPYYQQQYAAQQQQQQQQSQQQAAQPSYSQQLAQLAHLGYSATQQQQLQQQQQQQMGQQAYAGYQTQVPQQQQVQATSQQQQQPNPYNMLQYQQQYAMQGQPGQG